VLALTAAAVFVPAADAQVCLRPGRCIAAFSPGTAISAQIHAEANMLRAYGEAAVDFEVARNYRAKAVEMEIKNSVDYVRAYWDRRSIGEAERMKRHMTAARKQELRNSHLWKRLRDLPELSAESIPNGVALNFLLDRLAGGVLAYRFSEGGAELSLSSLEQLELPPQTIHQLRVRQDLATSGNTVFRLREGKPLDVDWWPAALRSGTFQSERKQFEAARTVLMASASDESLENNLKGTFKAYDDLAAAFHQHHTRSVRLKSVQDHRQYGLAKRFLQSLAGELYRIREVGVKALQNDSLRYDGSNLVSLLTHMSRNGLEFAPSLPGEEPAYQQLFHMMRDLYVAVGEDQAEKK
jgi:hypothetical protein